MDIIKAVAGIGLALGDVVVLLAVFAAAIVFLVRAWALFAGGSGRSLFVVSAAARISLALAALYLIAIVIVGWTGEPVGFLFGWTYASVVIAWWLALLLLGGEWLLARVARTPVEPPART